MLSTRGVAKMETKIITEASELTPGWYACAFGNNEGELQWGAAQILQYHGDGYWTDEDGNEKDRLFDPFLQTYVAMDAAEGYARQN